MVRADASIVPLNEITFTGGTVTITGGGGGNPVPSITTIAPASVQVNGAQFTLTVNGTNFVNGSIVRVNGVNRATTFRICEPADCYDPRLRHNFSWHSKHHVVQPRARRRHVEYSSADDHESGSEHYIYSAVLSSSWWSAVQADGEWRRLREWRSGSSQRKCTDHSLRQRKSIDSGHPRSRRRGRRCARTYDHGVQPCSGRRYVQRSRITATAPTQNPAPQVSGLAPLSVPANSATTLLTLQGLFFVPTAQVQWNGMNLKTTFRVHLS